MSVTGAGKARTKKSPKAAPKASPELSEEELDALRRASPSEDGPIALDGTIRPVQIGKRGRTPNELTTIFILDDVEYQIPAKPSPALVLRWMQESRVAPGASAQKRREAAYRATENVLMTLLGQEAMDALAASPDVTAEDMADIFAIVGTIFFGVQQRFQQAADPS